MANFLRACRHVPRAPRTLARSDVGGSWPACAPPARRLRRKRGVVVPMSAFTV